MGPPRLSRSSAQALFWRRRLVAVVVVGVAVAVPVVLASTGGGSPDGPKKTGAGTQATATKPAPPPQLPRGGRTIFPHFRVVAFYGAPQAAALGILGIGKPDAMARKLVKQSNPYRAGGRPVQPAMELIAVVANAHPGNDGMYRTRQPDSVIRRYLAAARRAKALLILDIQPGHAGFLTEARHLERWLREPDVSLALDPEWKVPDGAVPGKVIGSVGSREVNAVSYWLSGIVKRHDLPEKLLVLHRFTEGMIRNQAGVKKRDGLALVVNVDGFGTQSAKVAKYKDFAHSARSRFHNGFKLFYEEDTAIMRPGKVLKLKPRPELIVYE